ncbi:MAG: ribosome small subunit-dependent GTPase A [Thermoplasmatota archaeon]
MDLNDLGWGPELEKTYNQLGLDGAEGISVGRISFFDGTHYTIITESGDVRGRSSSKVLGEGAPAVGDWVVVKLSETGNIIIKVLPRSSCISRKVPGKEVQEQVIAANVDLLFIVMGADSDFNLRRLERYLAMAFASGSRPVVLLNKIDSIEDLEEKLELINNIADDVPVHPISALKGEGLEVLDKYLDTGITAALVGSSGVGKSTLINRLLREERQKTGDVRKIGGKGRHVTTSRELIVLPKGGILIDNPGLRELQLWGDENMLEEAFKDISDLSKGCRFRDCQHLSEPDCEVKRAVEDGTLDRSRYENYLKMRKELHHLSVKMDKGAQAQERARWRGLLKDVKHYYRYKREGK